MMFSGRLEIVNDTLNMDKRDEHNRCAVSRLLTVLSLWTESTLRTQGPKKKKQFQNPSGGFVARMAQTCAYGVETLVHHF